MEAPIKTLVDFALPSHSPFFLYSILKAIFNVFNLVGIKASPLIVDNYASLDIIQEVLAQKALFSDFTLCSVGLFTKNKSKTKNLGKIEDNRGKKLTARNAGL